MRGAIYVNGRVSTPETAVVSVLDRGFLYGDSVYETLRVYAGVPFGWSAHLARLQRSAGLIGMSVPWSASELERVARDTVREAHLGEHAYLRVIVTRGAGPMSLDPATATQPSLVVMALEWQPLPEAVYREGRRARIVRVQRNAREALTPLAKTGNYLNNVLAQGEAAQAGADEAILLDREGRVTEASSANVLALLDGVWCTPPVEVGLLDGITRGSLLMLGARAQDPIREAPLWPADLGRATELLVCSSLREVVPIVELDGRPVGSGKPGPRGRELHARYREYVRTSTREWS